MLKAIGSSASAPAHRTGEKALGFVPRSDWDLDNSGAKGRVPPVDFNFSQLDEPDLPEDDLQEKLGAVINAIAEWLYPSRSRSTTMVLRAYAFIWYVRPEWLGNPTQVELARRLRVSKACFGKIVNQMRKQFRFYKAGMRHEDARTKFAAHAKVNASKLADARRAKCGGQSSAAPSPRARGNSTGGAL